MLSSIINWVSTRVVLVLSCVVVVLVGALVLSRYSNKIKVMTLEAKIKEQQQVIDGFVVAAKFQEQKLNNAVALSNHEYKAAIKEIKSLEAGNLPTTPEEARKWALNAINGERK